MFEDYRAKGKQKPVRMDVGDWAILHEIGKALGGLPSVRRDSPQWAAWRRWFHDRGMSTAWSDNQPPERMMTVTFQFPPENLSEEYERHVRKKKSLQNIIQAKPADWTNI